MQFTRPRQFPSSTALCPPQNCTSVLSCCEETPGRGREEKGRKEERDRREGRGEEKGVRRFP